MKKHLSVLMLCARSTVYKMLGLFFAMAAAEILLFGLTLRGVPAGPPLGLEAAFDASRVSFAFAAAFLLLCALLCMTGCEYSGSRPSYTLRRLSVSRRTVLFWQSVYNILCLFLLWAVQLFVALLLCRLYMSKADPATVSGQTVFLAFYRNKFLHSLLPLAETSRYIRNLMLIVGLGVTAACFPQRQQRGQMGIAVIPLALIAAAVFPMEMGQGQGDFTISALALAAAGFAVFGIWKGPETDET